MDIKEQIAREIFEYDFTGFNPKWTECANKSHWLNLANKIIELFEQAGYIQLQADEKGLVSMGTIQELVKLPDGNNHCVYVHDVNIAKTQKALDDKEWEEKIESFWNGNYGYYVIPVREWELLKSQMKEGK